MQNTCDKTSFLKKGERLIPKIRGSFAEIAVHVQTQEYHSNDLLYKFHSSLRKKFQPIFELFNWSIKQSTV